ncbi:hypothetical protein HYALB_00007257 [Hymenoscyphus albidus]|uniref:Uncharacterized protein n=1 Tax=Hymenoscyphus albidus TaxID=595503 RepID=A0A9N9LIL3_9HELO|nr:hypothetical protein HYALB_00007257 [Hymenoscyphus albidus]
MGGIYEPCLISVLTQVGNRTGFTGGFKGSFQQARSNRLVPTGSPFMLFSVFPQPVLDNIVGVVLRKESFQTEEF